MALALADCAVGPDYKTQQPPSGQHYLSEQEEKEGVQTPHYPQLLLDQAPVDDWWKAFGSAELDAEVEIGLEKSPSLAQSMALLEEAKDQLRAGQGVFFPQIDTGASALRERGSPYHLTSPVGVFNLMTLSASVSYVFDIFGGERRAVEALHAQVDEQEALYAASRLALCGNIVNTSIAAAAYTEEADLLAQEVASQQESLVLLEAQVRGGTAAPELLLAQMASVDSNDAAIPALRQKQAAAEHLLKTLVGKTPDSGGLPALQLDQLAVPSQLPLSLPSDLVRQRPDIVAAEAALHAANAEVGISTANLYPSISLSGDYGLANTAFNQLGAAQSRFWSVGPSLNFPLFTGGSYWYQHKAAQEAYQSVLAQYRQTILGAFQQVADVLMALRHDAEAERSYQAALDATIAQEKLLNANYRAGLTPYANILSAHQQTLAAKSSLVQAKATYLQDSVAFYLAMGGGWGSPQGKASAASGIPKP